jgi:hypothetical protein
VADGPYGQATVLVDSTVELFVFDRCLHEGFKSVPEGAELDRTALGASLDEKGNTTRCSSTMRNILRSVSAKGAPEAPCWVTVVRARKQGTRAVARASKSA